MPAVVSKENTMNIQKEIRRQATALHLELADSDVNRLVGTVRFAHVRTASGLTQMVERELARLMQKVSQETTNKAANETKAGTFQKIDTSLSQGTCPRCGKKMQDVLLADYTPARNCGGDCRITLWPPEKKESK